MLRAFKCSSSGDSFVSIRYLAYVTQTVRYASLDGTALCLCAYSVITINTSVHEVFAALVGWFTDIVFPWLPTYFPQECMTC